MITPEQLFVLEAQDRITLAVWWCQLNEFKWPKDLPESDIRGWYRQDPRGWDVMAWIMERIGYKECLRVHNDETMTNEEFEAWWARGLGKLKVL